jgi:hypothetical protein
VRGTVLVAALAAAGRAGGGGGSERARLRGRAFARLLGIGAVAGRDRRLGGLLRLRRHAAAHRLLGGPLRRAPRPLA